MREFGSGNPGAVNIWRVFGLGYGLLVVVVDVSKGYFAAEILPDLFVKDITTAFAAFLGILAVCGHIWSPFTRFRGGKGVGAAFGAALAVYPIAAGIAIAIWIIVMLLTRYASVSSLMAAACYSVIIFWKYDPSSIEISVSILMIVLLIYTHRTNLQRLRHGSELKIGGNG